MNGFITTDLRGRMRLRLPRFALGPDDWQRLSGLINGLEGLSSCSYNERTAGLLIIYGSADPEVRSRILAVLASFEPEQAPYTGPLVKAVDEEEPMPHNPVWRHLAHKVLPMSIRAVMHGLKAIPHMIMGLGSLLKGRLNVEVLDASALAVCFLRRDFRAAGTLLFFFALGHYLEMWTKQRSRAGLFRSLASQTEKSLDQG